MGKRLGDKAKLKVHPDTDTPMLKKEIFNGNSASSYSDFTFLSRKLRDYYSLLRESR